MLVREKDGFPVAVLSEETVKAVEGEREDELLSRAAEVDLTGDRVGVVELRLGDTVCVCVLCYVCECSVV